MPGPILHVGLVATCPHGAPMSVAPGEPRVMLSGQPAATMADLYTIGGCPFQVPAGPSTKPQPCVKVQYTGPAARVLANGKPVMLGTSIGISQSIEQIPAGPPTVSVFQTRVVAS
ncbi:hypothetical protein [Caulobacter endophyticus]|uniref:hypothetical protein n=1 Tax=Caulobacter endophyticus TaxID=2172652 RepID=UPI00240F4944|nr:hypothetical protein [Caulobacter endophyticus]MDG2527889.1 hypothetical protein [Caulobacter endophyticus]